MLWLSTSGRARSTMRSPCSWKSGINTSTLHSGRRSRIFKMHWAKMNAPPSGRSSRFTEVITHYRSPIRSTVLASRCGSSRSRPRGLPEVTAQYRQARVQMSPKIINVAVPRSQQSPILGQWASSHTVCSSLLRSKLPSLIEPGPPGILTLNQGGSLDCPSMGRTAIFSILSHCRLSS